MDEIEKLKERMEILEEKVLILHKRSIDNSSTALPTKSEKTEEAVGLFRSRTRL